MKYLGNYNVFTKMRYETNDIAFRNAVVVYDRLILFAVLYSSLFTIAGSR